MRNLSKKEINNVSGGDKHIVPIVSFTPTKKIENIFISRALDAFRGVYRRCLSTCFSLNSYNFELVNSADYGNIVATPEYETRDSNIDKCMNNCIKDNFIAPDLV